MEALSELEDVLLFRTHDKEYIRSIFTHGDCFSRIRDDYTSSPERIDPQIAPHLIYLRPLTGGAVFMFHPQNMTLWSVHAAVLRTHRKSSVAFAKSCVKWMRENTACRAIMALIAKGNYPAMRLVEAVGFRWAGNIPNSVLVDGVLIDQRIYTLEIE